jgi:hypothetical protein
MMSEKRDLRPRFRQGLIMPLICVTASMFVACDRKDEEAAFIAQERADAVAAFERSAKKMDWRQAAIDAEAIVAKYPDSEEAKRVAQELPSIREKAEAARIVALWNYVQVSVPDGVQSTAAILAKGEVDVDGSGPTPVKLIFRDHPSWGRSSYLVLQRGDFDCYGGCKVSVTIDDKPAKAMDASRPNTDEAIAMFVEDERALWKMIDGARILRIDFPVKGMGKRTATFEVAGLDRTQLPKWN